MPRHIGWGRQQTLTVQQRENALATAAVVFVGVLWGLYWLPLRQVEAASSGGAWVTAAVVGIAFVVLLPFAWRGRSRLRASNRMTLFSIALGGGSFVLYSNALLFGQVAVVILLFYLTPVWSTLIGRVVLGWRIGMLRVVAIGLGLGGIALVLRGSHGSLPLPVTVGDWLGLASGILWAASSTVIRTGATTRAAETNFVFVAGALVTALALAPLLSGAGLPAVEAGALGPAVGWTAALGAFWWALSLAGLMWGAQRLEPARVGILLMGEVLVGTVSAALIASEPFGPPVAAGAVLVIMAGLLETLPASAIEALRGWLRGG